MAHSIPQPFFAVDIGNSRIKIARYDGTVDTDAPLATLDLAPDVVENDDLLSAALEAWLSEPNRGDNKPPSAAGHRSTGSLSPLPATDDSLASIPWWIGSVNWPLTASLSNAITRLAAGTVHKLSHDDLPLEIRVDAPDRVGIDRLLAAVAANQLRETDRPAIVVDLGTAITVDLVAADGAFEGGAILPGIGMAARAMAQQTDALPRSPMVALEQPPPPVGKSTLAAIESGLFWGAIGAVRELALRFTMQLGPSGDAGKTAGGAGLPAVAEGTQHSPKSRKTGTSGLPGMAPQLFLTGGAAPQIAKLLVNDDQPVHHVPHLVLSGIATTANQNRK